MSIVIAPDQQSFEKLVGSWAENAIAVAVSDAAQVVINLDALKRSPPDAFNETLVHEFTHLYIGVRCKAPVPRCEVCPVSDLCPSSRVR